MGKKDFLTPKAIANRIKAKCLQKLRWYCQICQKQCRDENGFKCHCLSESHQRQMQVFGQNPTRIVDGFSAEFESTFLNHMQRSHRFSRIAATVVYNKYINDRHHVHMNSTQWATLTDFVKYLGREGKCKVDETPKGWFITYIDRDSETVFKERLKTKRAKAEANETRVGFAIGSKAPKPDGGGGSRVVFDEDGEGGGEGQKKKKTKLSSAGEKPMALDELMREEETQKKKANGKDYWVCSGIVVKVMSKGLSGRRRDPKRESQRKGLLKKRM